VLVGLAVLIGVIGDGLVHGWWSQTTAFLAVWWPRLVLATAVVAVFLRLAWWLWWGLPKLQVDRLRLADPKDRGEVEDNYRKTAGQLLGGAAVLVGAGFAYVQFTQQQRDAHDLLISNQVAKGFELLGHKNRSEARLRLGGIYALEGVMNTSEQYHQPVLETLCAFVRDETRTKADDDKAEPTTEIQAALTVIGRRKSGLGKVDLGGVHIPKADLADASLSGAWLRDANLRDAYLGGADLSGTMLMDANLYGAQLYGTDLSEAFLYNADLTGVELYGYIGRHAFRSANLRAAELVNAKLFDAHLDHANLTDAKMSDTYLVGAELDSADLRGATLVGAGLNDAKLTHANLYGASLDGANLYGADLSGADLSGVSNLTQDQLKDACGDDKTKLDPPLTIKPCAAATPVPPPN
jgi:uncharacterized protein YjbI with pentapeptide repeats